MKLCYGLAAGVVLLLGGTWARCGDTDLSRSAPAPVALGSPDGAACPGKCKTYLPRGFQWCVDRVPERPWCSLRTYGGGMATEWFTYCPGPTRCHGDCCQAAPCCAPPLYAFFLYPPARATAQLPGPPALSEIAVVSGTNAPAPNGGIQAGDGKAQDAGDPNIGKGPPADRIPTKGKNP
jgi:hypothetical protein